MTLPTPRPLKVLLTWVQRLLFVSATVLLGYCGYVMTDSWIYQKTQQRRFEQLLTNRQEETGGQQANEDARQDASFDAIQPEVNQYAAPPTPLNDDLIGRLEIPRLGLKVIVMEGSDEITLRRAAGHIEGTALPGEPGNIGISGHRDTFFRPLQKIRLNDIIRLTTVSGDYSYRVISTSVVGPEDVSVLEPDGNEILTLVTCYPFYFIGAAPNRFIVRASLDGRDGQTPDQ